MSPRGRPESFEEFIERHRRMRAAQGLPAEVTDIPTLDKIATIVLAARRTQAALSSDSERRRSKNARGVIGVTEGQAIRSRRVEVVQVGSQWRAETTDDAQHPTRAHGRSPEEALIELTELLLDRVNRLARYAGYAEDVIGEGEQ